MPWADRTPYRQPPDWPRTRTRILNRDHRVCYVCGQPGATEVDHIRPVSEGGTHHDHNLAAIHTTCHKTKTQQEAARARARKPKRQRPTEPHPGMT